MVSVNNFVLLIQLTITLILVAEASQGGRTIPSNVEKKELERQLKSINKPAIKSFKTAHGDIFDCIDIHKQLAFDHHLLKNHTVQLKPTIVPEWIKGNTVSGKVDPLQLLNGGITCPDGTIIVRRTTIQDLMHAQRLKSMGFNGPRHFLKERNKNDDVPGQYYIATLDYGPSSFFGVKGTLNIWEPQVSQDQVSLAFMAVAGGPKEHFSSIFVGWTMNPSLYQQDHVRLYAYWTTHLNDTGCYPETCPGFVQVSKKVTFGAILQPPSIYNSSQYEMTLALYQDTVKGDWWFAYNTEIVGYWPSSLFMDSGFANKANYASWGGQVFSPVTETTPSMGSGHWPEEGVYKAAYINGIKIIEGPRKVFTPKIKSLKARETDSKCYRAMYVHDKDKDPWQRTLFYGGPPGCIGK